MTLAHASVSLRYDTPAGSVSTCADASTSFETRSARSNWCAKSAARLPGDALLASAVDLYRQAINSSSDDFGSSSPPPLLLDAARAGVESNSDWSSGVMARRCPQAMPSEREYWQRIDAYWPRGSSSTTKKILPAARPPSRISARNSVKFNIQCALERTVHAADARRYDGQPGLDACFHTRFPRCRTACLAQLCRIFVLLRRRARCDPAPE